jgi:hypothetical protein
MNRLVQSNVVRIFSACGTIMNDLERQHEHSRLNALSIAAAMGEP